MENKKSIIPAELFNLAAELKSLIDTKKHTEKEVEDIKAQIKKIEEQLAQIMTREEIQNFTRNGTTFSLRVSPKASAVAGLKTELYETLKEKGYGDLVYETVNPQSLSSFVKERLSENEDKLPEWLDGLVNVFEKTNVSVRKHSKN